MTGLSITPDSISISLDGESALFHDDSNQKIYECDVSLGAFSNVRMIPLEYPPDYKEEDKIKGREDLALITFPIYMENNQERMALTALWDVDGSDVWKLIWDDGGVNIKSASVGEIKARFK